MSIARVCKVAVVNGDTEITERIEEVLNEGYYEIIFLDGDGRAYSQIREIRPDIVIICMRVDDGLGFQLLTVLTVDPETHDIPTLTCLMDGEGCAEAVSPYADDEGLDLYARGSVSRMN